MLKIFFIVYFVIGVLYSLFMFNEYVEITMGACNDQARRQGDDNAEQLRPLMSIITFLIVTFLWAMAIIPKKK